MEEKEVPPKIIFDIDKAIEKILDKRGVGISNVVVLIDETGRRSEVQSSNENLDKLLSKAHSSMDKLKGTNGTKEVPGYVE